MAERFLAAAPSLATLWCKGANYRYLGGAGNPLQGFTLRLGRVCSPFSLYEYPEPVSSRGRRVVQPDV